MPLLRMEVVGKPNDGDVEPAHAIRASHHTLLHHCFGNFLRFHSQDEHNASFYLIKSRQPYNAMCLQVGGAKIRKKCIEWKFMNMFSCICLQGFLVLGCEATLHLFDILCRWEILRDNTPLNQHLSYGSIVLHVFLCYIHLSL